MGNATSLAMALLVGFSGCAAIRGPAWEPTTTGSETTEGEGNDDETNQPDYDEVEPFDPESSVAEPGDSGDSDQGDAETEAGPGAPGAAGTESAPPPAKKSCAELDETTCQITVGCAWDSVKNCVDE